MAKQQQPNIVVNVTNAQTQTSAAQPMYNNGKEIVTRNYWIMLVLSILLGWCGADRFYAGHIGLGILKLLTFGGFYIWWIIDIIMVATKNIRYVRFE
jgi:TM2 domain-containing membrane protein YozV